MANSVRTDGVWLEQTDVVLGWTAERESGKISQDLFHLHLVLQKFRKRRTLDRIRAQIQMFTTVTL